MQIKKVRSVRRAKSLLHQRGALESCQELACRCSDKPGENQKLFHDLGFELEWSFNAGGNRPRFDAYSQKWKVGVEREMQEQMNVRSHLLLRR